MKTALTIITLCLLSLGVTGQNLAKQRARLLDSTTDHVAEYLVELAMKNSQIASSENMSKQLDFTYRRAKTAYLDNLFVAGNLNEYSIKKDGQNDPLRGATQFPRYNIGVRIPIGMFINNPKETDAAYHRYQASIDDTKTIKSGIRKQVLVLYEGYKMTREMLTLQQEVVQDSKVLATRIEERFEKGEASLEVYTAATKGYNAERARIITLTHELEIAEAQIEELIGVKLEKALQEARK
ncbi:MAG: TolC family protein [Flavitalea sp.]